MPIIPSTPQQGVSEEERTPNDTHLTILLWNVWLLPPPLSDFIVRSRASRISPLLASYDLVVLNEAFTCKSKALRDAKYPYQVQLGRKSWWSLFDSGLIILSAHPIIKVEKEHFRSRRRWDKLASKGIILCRIRISDGSELDVYATHMQAGHSDSEQESRERQAHQLCEFIIHHSGEKGRQVVLVGDLNMGPARYADLSGYSVHYASLLDARRRVGTYEVLKKIANLTDVISPGWEQDINRFLVRGIQHAEVEYLEKPRYDENRHLSDSERLVCRIQIPVNG